MYLEEVQDVKVLKSLDLCEASEEYPSPQTAPPHTLYRFSPYSGAKIAVPSGKEFCSEEINLKFPEKT